MNEETNIPNNLEIDKALKEFEAKSATEQMPKAPETSKISFFPQEKTEGVKYEADNYKAVKFYKENNAPKIVRLVMKCSGGLIKEERQAEYVLFGLVIIMLAVSFYLFLGGKNTPQQPSAEQLKQFENM
ncbi:MAG: hypothetical protein AAB595_01215 [Patescibacteria group bacterium]